MSRETSPRATSQAGAPTVYGRSGAPLFLIIFRINLNLYLTYKIIYVFIRTERNSTTKERKKELCFLKI